MRKTQHYQRGSYTVEASILFTFIIVVLFTFIFGIMVLYQTVFLQKAINSAVINAADSVGYTGEVESAGSNFQRQLLQGINEELEVSIFSVPDAREMVTVKKVDGNLFMSNRVKIIIKQDISIPMGQIKAFFTGSDSLTISAATYCIEDSTVKTIRNTDLAIEVAKRAQTKFEPLMKKILKIGE